MTRFALPLALLLAIPVHAQTDSPSEPAADPECSRLRTEIARTENAKRAAVEKQQTAWKAVIPFAVIAQHSSATSKVTDADKRLSDLNAELTRRGLFCAQRDMKRALAASAVCTAALFHVPVAQPDGLAAKSATSARGSHGAAGRRQGVVADGQGNAAAGSQRSFATDSGAHGARTSRFRRSSDGTVDASTNAYASGSNGTAQRNGAFSRNADGTASGERSTTVTNANTGTTFDASTSYNKDSGVSHSASCRDASGNTVSCGSR